MRAALWMTISFQISSNFLDSNVFMTSPESYILIYNSLCMLCNVTLYCNVSKNNYFVLIVE